MSHSAPGHEIPLLAKKVSIWPDAESVVSSENRVAIEISSQMLLESSTEYIMTVVKRDENTVLLGMPLYEYRCNNCDNTFDTLIRSLEGTPSVTCKLCSSADVHRLVSRFAMVGGFDDTFVSSPDASAGGCCGGSCGCRH
jgi:putative FmdB family regulatory protein